MVERGDDAQVLVQWREGGGLESYSYDVRCLFLCPNDHMKHTKVVNRCCKDMVLHHGLLNETTDLQLSDQLPDMAAQAIGYRQMLDYLQHDNFAQHDCDALNAYLNGCQEG